MTHYSQQVMFPYSTSKQEIPEEISNKEEIMELTLNMTNTIQAAYGAIYEPGMSNK